MGENLFCLKCVLLENVYFIIVKCSTSQHLSPLCGSFSVTHALRAHLSFCDFVLIYRPSEQNICSRPPFIGSLLFYHILGCVSVCVSVELTGSVPQSSHLLRHTAPAT